MTDTRSKRLRRAAHHLEQARNAIDQLHLSDMSANNVEEVKELQSDMYAWMSDFEDWADAAENEENDE